MAVKLSGLSVETLARMADNMERCAAQRSRMVMTVRFREAAVHIDAAERYLKIAAGCREEIALLNGGGL